MSLYAWPFLVSRNQLLGYRTVVAPDFMVQAGMAGLLANEVGGEVNSTLVRHVFSKTKVGVLTVFYRVLNATQIDRSFRDEAGRPILWIEGVVLRGGNHDYHVTINDLERVHTHLKESYNRFWGQHSSDFPVESSNALVVENDNLNGLLTGPAEQVNEPSRKGRPAPSQWIVSTVLAALLIITVSFVVFQQVKITRLSKVHQIYQSFIELNKRQISQPLRDQFFEEIGKNITKDVRVTITNVPKWTIVDGNDRYTIEYENQRFNIRNQPEKTATPVESSAPGVVRNYCISPW